MSDRTPLADERDSLRDRIASLEAELSRAQKETLDYSIEVAGLALRCESLEAENVRLVSGLESVVGILQGSLAKRDARTRALEAEHKFLNDLKNERTDERDAARAELAAMREKLRGFHDDLHNEGYGLNNELLIEMREVIGPALAPITPEDIAWAKAYESCPERGPEEGAKDADQ